MLVIDTSYLLELYRIPGCFSAAAHDEVWKRFEKALMQKSPIYVPFPAIFEVANHIAHVKDGDKRTRQARQFVAIVLKSIDQGTPFVVIPKLDVENLKLLLDVFAKDFVSQGVGLTDTSIIEEAKRLKREHATRQVHIWTTDKGLKAREPDPEPDAFIG